MDLSVLTLSQEELDAETRIIEEFRDISNSQVFEHVFRRRMMALKRGVAVPQSPSDLLGVDSRELMYPSLCETLHSVIDHNLESKNTSEFHLLDVGAGSGEAIDWFFAKELKKGSNGEESSTGSRKIFVHAIEPNPIFLESYRQKLMEYQHLHQGIVHQGPIQDYLGNIRKETLPMPPVPVDFVNCMQMIYYLTDTKKPNIDPQQDIIKFITFLYGLLKPGGAIYIAFLDMGPAFASLACKFYEQIVGDFETPKRIFQTIKARNELLHEGNILKVLGDAEKKEKTRPKLVSHRLPSGFFARTLADMAVLALTELLELGDNKFDTRALDFMITQLKLAINVPGEPKPFGLTKCIRGDENVWRVDHPLIICVIRKELITE